MSGDGTWSNLHIGDCVVGDLRRIDREVGDILNASQFGAIPIDTASQVGLGLVRADTDRIRFTRNARVANGDVIVPVSETVSGISADGNVAVSVGVAPERPISDGGVVFARCICQQRFIPCGRVANAIGVVGKRQVAGGRVVVSGAVVQQSAVASGGVSSARHGEVPSFESRKEILPSVRVDQSDAGSGDDAFLA